MDYQSCVTFHGHHCGGLAIGYRMSEYFTQLLGLKRDEDEELLAICETDSCLCDSVSVCLGVSIGKGNLILKMRGKTAVTVFCRKTFKGYRLTMKQLPQMEKSQRENFILNAPFDTLFEKKEANDLKIEKAKIFNSYKCETCGEMTSENFLRLENGKKVCLDCHHEYKRII